jgi:hypothetical protein
MESGLGVVRQSNEVQGPIERQSMITPIRSFVVVFALALAAMAQDTFPALLTDKPAKENRDKLMLFGQFIGSWSYEGTEYRANGTRAADKGEVHFHWILQGRAVQDVWRDKTPGEASPIYGTTIRFYDPKNDSWKVTWIEPARSIVLPMTGRKVGSEIVMEATTSSGSVIHWIFSGIQRNSFRWRAERLVGGHWQVYEEVFAKRMN